MQTSNNILIRPSTMLYITNFLLVLPVLATQHITLSTAGTNQQVYLQDIPTEAYATSKSVLINWGHFGQTDFPRSTQHLAIGPAQLAQLPTDVSGKDHHVDPYDDVLLSPSFESFPDILNDAFLTTGDWLRFCSIETHVDNCGWNIEDGSQHSKGACGRVVLCSDREKRTGL